jgi:ribosomal protein S18 acetylase RimI-like enzyme
MENEFTALPMQKEHIGYVIDLLFEESVKAALHLEDTPRAEWEKSLHKNLRDKDEANFIRYRGNGPVGWLKLNGLKGDKVWISMLAVHPAHQRNGAGRFAVRYAEEFARKRGFAQLKVHTTPDNAPAKACYETLGYTLTEETHQLTYMKQT